MPTGLTVDILEKDISFKMFVAGCAAACNRDHLIVWDAEKLAFVVHESGQLEQFDERIEEAREELTRLRYMTLEEATQQVNKEWCEENAARLVQLEQAKENCGRYEAVRAKVSAWQPPSEDHEKLKELMLQQLAIGFEMDCNVTALSDEEPIMDVKDWLHGAIAAAEYDLKRLVENRDDAQWEFEESRQWAQALCDNLNL